MREVIIIGSGLGGLATALRLTTLGYRVTILEKGPLPGGRLNQLKLGGFTFDVGPSFMSMSYEFRELFESCGLSSSLQFTPLEPLYQVFFEGRRQPYRIWKDLHKLEMEFSAIEPGLADKVSRYLDRAAQFFHDTEQVVIKTNFKNKFDYLAKLAKVPLRHLPYLFRNMWHEAERHFESEEVRIVFCLVAFFLGSTPFHTPAIYSLLNYTELKHDGYWMVEGGMYRIVEELCTILEDRGVRFVFNTEVIDVQNQNGSLQAVIDQNGQTWTADLFVSNADAASFRGQVLGRPQYSTEKLDQMDWSLAPFTIYLGVRGKIDGLMHHNYFLGNNFREYAGKIFTSAETPSKPYYYVNVSSKSFSESAPANCENLFILCPVPDLRFKSSWQDKEQFADHIIRDLSSRIGFDIVTNIIEKKVYSPVEWADMFNLYRGSGLGLNHGLNQVGGLRPRNKDEHLDNLYYVGASTVPGTGLPMVIISSKLAMERILADHGSLS